MKLSHYQTEIKLGLLFALVALAVPDVVFAQNVDFGAAQSTFASSELNYGPVLASAIAYVAGTIFSFAGILKLKAHSENPGQTPLSHGLGRLAAGGALLALPSVTSVVAGTMATGLGGSSGATALSFSAGLQ